ncbi:MAG: hypothetical protein U0R26_12015 [Solirubrobacterales bacterium]
MRYLWMAPKQIIGSHFANAYECMKANQLMAGGKVRPVLTGQDDGLRRGVPATRLMHENKHLGKIAVLVGADEGTGNTEDGPGAIRAGGRRVSCFPFPSLPGPTAPYRSGSNLRLDLPR